MSSNNLLIGLGGTGGKVIAAMRRLMFQHHDSPEPDNIALDYLYIDTSKRETALARHGTGLAANDKRWRYLGNSVQLAPAQVVHLNNSSFGTIVKNVENYPRIASWLGDAETWNGYWDSQKGEMEAAGQIRRFGRIVLAQNLDAATQGLRSRIQALRDKTNIVDWNFHIVAGLAGGTGSGTFLDVVRMVQNAARGVPAKILVYTVLPEAEESSWSNGNYHANGYAALSELNALQVDRLALTDLASGTVAELPSVKACWIITNRNDKGIRFDVDKTLPNLMAEALYQIYVASGEATLRRGNNPGPAGNAGEQRSWMDSPTGENLPLDMNKEKDDPSNAKMGPFDRFNSFITFGIKSIAVPVEEVQEYSSLIFLRQFVLQALNNNWVPNDGFSETVARLDHSAISKNPDLWERWLFTDKHLKLETGSMVNDTGWRMLREEFARGINGKATEIQSIVKDSAAWPRAVEDHARDFFENTFRNSGVHKFYVGADRSKEDRAKLVVRDRMAGQLFENWLAGVYSIYNVIEIVHEIAREAEERRQNCDESVAKFSRLEGEIGKTLASLKLEYSKLGLIGGALKGKKLFARIVETLIDLNTAKSQRAAFGYMASVLAAILTELEKLQGDVGIMKDRFDEALKDVDIAIASRVEGDDVNVAGSGQYKFYKPGLVREVLRQLQRNENRQKDQAKALRTKIVELVGGSGSFRSFADKAPAGMIVTSLEEAATAQAIDALNELDTGRDRILGSSIIEKLYEDFGNSREKLADFLAHRVAEAQPLAAIDDAEVSKTSPSWKRTVTVAFVPARDKVPENLRPFHDTLTAAIRNAGEGLVHIVETSDQPERIVILSFLDRFPLRMLKNLQYLRGFYDQKMKDGKDGLAAMMLHVEGDGSNLPELYAADPDKFRKRAAPYWLIAQCLDMLRDRTNPETGRNEAILEFKDSSNFGDRVFLQLGDSVAEGLKKLNITNALVLMRVVKEALGQIVHVDDQSKIMDKLREVRDAALKEAGDNPNNAKFKEVDESVKEARSKVMS